MFKKISVSLLLASSLISSAVLAEPFEKMYNIIYSAGYGLYRQNLDTSSPQFINNALTAAIDYKNNKIYYGLQSDAVIYKSNLDGSNVETVVDLDSYSVTSSVSSSSLTFTVGHIAIDSKNNKIYITDYIDGNIFRCNLDGSNLEFLFGPNPYYPTGIYVDTVNDKIYEYGQVGLVKRNLDGTNPMSMFTRTSNTFVFDVEIDHENGKIYWSDFNPARIDRANLDGSDLETVYLAPTHISGEQIQSIELNPKDRNFYISLFRHNEIRSVSLSD
ncbi:MAG: hypothetical protein KC414_13180, partial [Romboutsia sp.]|nr:hypothetical protein [Romboutsia sp.]